MKLSLWYTILLAAAIWPANGSEKIGLRETLEADKLGELAALEFEV